MPSSNTEPTLNTEPAPADPLVAHLRAFDPQGDQEARDHERILALASANTNPWDRSLPLHITASALIVHPSSCRVLLRWHARQNAWLQVGGHGDPGETDPLQIALREGREEAGLTDLMPWPQPVLQHLVIVNVPANHREPAHEHADLRFFLATDDPDSATPEDPTGELRWLRPADATALTTEANVRETIARAERLFGTNRTT